LQGLHNIIQTYMVLPFHLHVLCYTFPQSANKFHYAIYIYKENKSKQYKASLKKVLV
jgi:hypothetical protein